MGKRKKKIVKPHYVSRDERARTVPKKPMPRGMKIGLIFCACALALAVILFFVLYDDGSLPMANGAPVMESDNWIITNVSESGNAKYYKTGEIEAIDGYTLDPTNMDQSGLRVYSYFADDPASQMTDYIVTGISRTPAENAQTANANYYMWDSTLEISGVQTQTIGDREASYFTTLTPPAEESVEATAETTAETEGEEVVEVPVITQRQQQMVCYLPALRDSTILVNLTLNVSEEQPPLDDAELLAMLEEIVAKITFEEKK